MKYFICALNMVNLGFPAEQTERIIPVNRVQTNIMEYENQEFFISIPALFGQNEISVPHGIVLKAGTPKTVLLTPKIDIDLEIPEEKIHELPKSFSGVFSFCKGVCFAENKNESSADNGNIILILNPMKLREAYYD